MLFNKFTLLKAISAEPQFFRLEKQIKISLILDDYIQQHFTTHIPVRICTVE